MTLPSGFQSRLVALRFVWLRVNPMVWVRLKGSTPPAAVSTSTRMRRGQHEHPARVPLPSAAMRVAFHTIEDLLLDVAGEAQGECTVGPQSPSPI